MAIHFLHLSLDNHGVFVKTSSNDQSGHLYHVIRHTEGMEDNDKPAEKPEMSQLHLQDLY